MLQVGKRSGKAAAGQAAVASLQPRAKPASCSWKRMTSHRHMAADDASSAQPTVQPRNSAAAHLYAAVHQLQRLGGVAQLVVVLSQVEQRPAAARGLACRGKTASVSARKWQLRQRTPASTTHAARTCERLPCSLPPHPSALTTRAPAAPAAARCCPPAAAAPRSLQGWPPAAGTAALGAPPCCCCGTGA